MSELDDGDAAFKDLPYYKAIFKSFLRKQIQHLLEELSSETGEESIILTANINNGTLSHLGSCTGKGFLEGREDIKKQFLSYCLKTYHGQKTHESQSPYQRTHQSPRIGSSPAAKRPRHQAASSSPVILHEHNKVPVHHTPSTATSPYSEVGSLYTTGTNSAEQSNEDTNNVKIEKTETEGKNHSSELSLPLFAKMSSTTSSSTSVDYQYKASDLGSHTQSSADVYGETSQGTDTHFEHKGETSEVDYGCREIKREPDDIDDMEITGVDAAGDSSMSFENWGQGQYGLGTSTTDLNEGSANNISSDDMLTSHHLTNMDCSKFATVLEEDLQQQAKPKDSESTLRTMRRSVLLFREFLGPENSEFETSSKSELNTNLRLFFASLRTQSGSNMKKNSLTSVRYGLSKYLKEKCSIDIKSEKEFATSQHIFKAKLKDMKNTGLGTVDHKPAITDEDLRKLSDPNCPAFDLDTPWGLQKKVWFDIMYFLCRKGREKLRCMTKCTFGVATDPNGREYVYHATPETDNDDRMESQADTDGEGKIYASEGNSMCPVTSYKKYIGKLHPESDDLWQRPVDRFEAASPVWYSKSPLGKNTLGRMMSDISKAAQLSMNYTNHCVRATSVTALNRTRFTPVYIMGTTGHKTEATACSYSCTLSENNFSNAFTNRNIQTEKLEENT